MNLLAASSEVSENQFFRQLPDRKLEASGPGPSADGS